MHNKVEDLIKEVKIELSSIYDIDENIDVTILDFDVEIEGKQFEKQTSYQLWHLLYSYEGDKSKSGNEKLFEQLQKKFGFKRDFANILSNINLSK